MHKTLKAAAGLCMIVGALFVSSTAAGAQECGGGGYFDPACEVLLEVEYSSTVTSGGTVVLSGTLTTNDPAGLPDDCDSVVFTIADQEIGSLDIDDDGTFSGTLPVPSIAAGDYTITAASCEVVADGPITVVARNGNVNNPGNTNTTNNGTTPLARTGFDATPMITLGAAALVLGAAAVYGSKRRRLA